MQAMILPVIRQSLQLTELSVPDPGPEQVLIQVRACGVCRTDLHVVDGELPEPKLPLIPGHDQGAIADESRTEQGSRMGVVHFGRKGKAKALISERVLCVTAVKLVTGESGLIA